MGSQQIRTSINRETETEIEVLPFVDNKAIELDRGKAAYKLDLTRSRSEIGPVRLIRPGRKKRTKA